MNKQLKLPHLFQFSVFSDVMSHGKTVHLSTRSVRPALTGQDIYLSVSSRKFVMLKAGDLFRAGKQGGVVGAFLKGGTGCIGVMVYHIIRFAGTKNLTIGTSEGGGGCRLEGLLFWPTSKSLGAGPHRWASQGFVRLDSSMPWASEIAAYPTLSTL